MRPIVLKRVFVLEYLQTHPCTICGETDPVVLEFDHSSNYVKAANISKLINSNCSMKRLIAEIDKCQVLCANCHRRKTAKDCGSYKLMTVQKLHRIVDSLPRANSKLDKWLAMEIRSKYIPGVVGMQRLANEYGVSKTTVKRIILGEYYK